MRVVPTGDEHKGGMVKDEQMTFDNEKTFSCKLDENTELDPENYS